MPNTKPLKMTRGERLLIKRLNDGLNQNQAAAAAGVAKVVYAGWEKDRGENIPIIPKTIYATKLQKCIIARRRENMLQRELAEKMDCSRLWVVLMETGKADPKLLLSYWGF